MAKKLTELFQCMGRKEAIQQEFKDASIIHIYKNGREILASVTTMEAYVSYDTGENSIESPECAS